MKYKLHKVCSTKGCGELVPVPKLTDEKVYCEKCTKKLKK